jgi:hypothetical protein
LYAPMAAAVWPAQLPDCCKNGMCPMRMHHATAARNQNMPMDCAHQMSHMPACSLSCCHPAEKAAVSPRIFVLPQMEPLAGPSEALAPSILMSAAEILRFSDPPSPPPRIPLLAR